MSDSLQSYELNTLNDTLLQDWGASQVSQWQRICLPGRNMGLIPGLGRFPWRKKWQLTSVFLPEKFHGQRRLTGYRLHGVTKSWARISNWPTTITTTLPCSILHFRKKVTGWKPQGHKTRLLSHLMPALAVNLQDERNARPSLLWDLPPTFESISLFSREESRAQFLRC